MTERLKVDLTGFDSPEPFQKPAGEEIQQLHKVAKERGFDRPTTAPTAPPSRRRNLGRSQPFATRITPQTNEDIYWLADELKAHGLADVVELAIARLKADYLAGKLPKT
jgi:orotidine-5'-phosphate decarboxylase